MMSRVPGATSMVSATPSKPSADTFSRWEPGVTFSARHRGVPHELTIEEHLGARHVAVDAQRATVGAASAAASAEGAGPSAGAAGAAAAGGSAEGSAPGRPARRASDGTCADGTLARPARPRPTSSSAGAERLHDRTARNGGRHHEHARRRTAAADEGTATCSRALDPSSRLGTLGAGKPNSGREAGARYRLDSIERALLQRAPESLAVTVPPSGLVRRWLAAEVDAQFRRGGRGFGNVRRATERTTTARSSSAAWRFAATARATAATGAWTFRAPTSTCRSGSPN